VRSDGNRDAAVNPLADMSVWIDQLSRGLDARSSVGLGVGQDELTDDTRELARRSGPELPDKAAQEVRQREA
jgi:hypothetical protein